MPFQKGNKIGQKYDKDYHCNRLKQFLFKNASDDDLKELLIAYKADPAIDYGYKTIVGKVAEYLGISRTTFLNWLNKHNEFANIFINTNNDKANMVIDTIDSMAKFQTTKSGGIVPPRIEAVKFVLKKYLDENLELADSTMQEPQPITSETLAALVKELSPDLKEALANALKDD